MTRPNVREQLLEAALDQLHGAGFNGSSVEDITRSAGVPKGSFYNHFKSKEDLAIVVIDRYVASGPQGRLLKKKIAPVKRLKQYFSLLAEEFAESGYKKGCLIGNFSSELSDHSTLVQSKVKNVFSNWIALLSGVIKEAQDQGEIESKQKADALAGFLISAWEGTLLRARAEHDPAILKEFEHIAFHQLLK